ncbi:MalY/PatB family protein [Virgibacillus xinjiangensis]|uniref:cysteine-S-conjugate beta-lyase n=1 Tax=Virgibacillus xinjiangensis TaxID=393090 RepID=A0ABV7CZ16_9BACI
MNTFDLVHDRRNTRSVKWDMLEPVFQSKEVLPMWVADMDFQAPAAVNEAIIKRAEHGIYGYTVTDDDVKSPITDWIEKRHDWNIDKNWLTFSPGVVTSLHMAVQALTSPGDNILIQSPVYTPFYKVIQQHDRNVVKSPLVLENGYYTIDFADFEEKLKQGVKAFILCSPHNPVGRVWKKEELEKMAELCRKHDVLILSDEIHADLTHPGYKHVPIASLSEETADRTITFMSPSKTFNLAGLQASYIITTDKEKKKVIEEHLTKQGHGMLNTMGDTAMEAAYRHGEEWLEELRKVLLDNYTYVKEQLEKHTEIKVIEAEGTYLLWMDCSSLGLNSNELKNFMIHEAKIGLNTGVDYGTEGETFMRMNLACPKATVEEGVKRIIEATQNK